MESSELAEFQKTVHPSWFEVPDEPDTEEDADMAALLGKLDSPAAESQVSVGGGCGRG